MATPDERSEQININIHRDRIGGDQVGGDKTTMGNVSESSGIAAGRRAAANVEAGNPRRRSMYEDELMPVLYDLRDRVTRLEVTVTHLNEELRARASFGSLQWWIITMAVALGTGAAGWMLAGGQ